MEIKVLGTGCPKCKTLEKAANEAVNELGVDARVTKEEDIMKIMGYGVMRTPGLVINDKVVASGKLLSVSEIKSLITENKQS
ncbi:MAG: thioredoxin family protein [Mariniphaga sp.]|nr:thioredoxin family protein [Mariniphaga sp.]